MSNEKRVEFNPELYKSVKEKILELTGSGEEGGIYEDMEIIQEDHYYDESCGEEFYQQELKNMDNPYNCYKLLKLKSLDGNYNHNSLNELELTEEESQARYIKQSKLSDEQKSMLQEWFDHDNEMGIGKPVKKCNAYIDKNGNKSDGFYTWIPQDGPDGLPDFVEHDTEHSIFISKDVDEKVAYAFFKTYFARLCLYIGVNSPGEYDSYTYPWSYYITPGYFGFHKEWTDEELFAKAGLTDEEIAEVYRVLPKFYD